MNGPGRPDRPPRPDQPPRQDRPPRPDRPLGLSKLGSAIGLAGILAVAAGLLAVAGQAIPSPGRPATPASGDPYSARWVCPLLPGGAPNAHVVNVGSGRALVRTTALSGGRTTGSTSTSMAPGQASSAPVPAVGPAGGVLQVEAFGAPVMVSVGGQPACSPGTGDHWWLADGGPGATSTGGAHTELVLANPNAGDATVAVVPHGVGGAVHPPELAQVLVPHRSAVRLDLDKPAALPRYSIEVIARQGQVAVGQVIVAGSGGTPILSVPGQSTVHSTWWFPGGQASPEDTTELLLTNPGSDPLSVDVTVASTKGTTRPAGFEDLVVPANNTKTQVLQLQDDLGPFSLRVSSRSGSRFEAALKVTTAGQQGQERQRIDPGTGTADRRWVVPPVAGGQPLVLANMGATPLVARVEELNGRRQLQQVPIAPGKVVTSQPGKSASGVIVESNGQALLVAPLGAPAAVPASVVGGLPAPGPVVPGPVARP